MGVSNNVKLKMIWSSRMSVTEVYYRRCGCRCGSSWYVAGAGITNSHLRIPPSCRMGDTASARLSCGLSSGIPGKVRLKQAFPEPCASNSIARVISSGACEKRRIRASVQSNKSNTSALVAGFLGSNAIKKLTAPRLYGHNSCGSDSG